MKLFNLFFLYLSLNIVVVLAKRQRIVGGQLANIIEFPHQVAIVLLDANRVVCGGTIISNWYILTAAHCIYRREAYIHNVRIFAGNANSKRRMGAGYPIEKLFPHPQYTGETSTRSLHAHDIGVLKVGVAIVFNEYQNKIKLPTFDMTFIGREVQMSGWGIKSYPSEETSEYLYKMKAKVVKLSDCNKNFHFPITTYQFCTLKARGEGVCSGDSGGAVVYNNYVVGIISYNVPCARGAPDVHTNVYSYLPFIKPFAETNHLM